jgi:hypothetical protein
VHGSTCAAARRARVSATAGRDGAARPPGMPARWDPRVVDSAAREEVRWSGHRTLHRP